ncbi:MAG: hypothetical protein AABX55_02605, partial [Nanoarchaeota archaeon]
MRNLKFQKTPLNYIFIGAIAFASFLLLYDIITNQNRKINNIVMLNNKQYGVYYHSSRGFEKNYRVMSPSQNPPVYRNYEEYISNF